MYAVIETGSKQYKVSEGDFIEVEKLDIEAGKSVTFDKVYLIAGDGEPKIGTPLVGSAKVSGTVEDQFKDKKVISFKQKRRKGYKKMHGHRQQLSRVKITKITG